MPADQARYCLITGAAGGIGRTLVTSFREAGYRVVAADRNDQPEGMLCDRYVNVDLEQFVVDEPYAASVISEIRSEIDSGALHALVNNAAIQILGGTASLTRSDWRTTLDVNLIAPFLLTQAFLPELERARGAVVNISSIHATLTKVGFVAYATSKAALSGMTRALAIDLGARVKVNAIEPAAIDTDMLRAGFCGNEAAFRELEAAHPCGSIGDPESVSRLALMLADAESHFLHGACIEVSGGIGARLHDPA